MTKASLHFDADALLDEVHKQPIGLRISTNHPAGFRRILYQATRRNPARRVQVLQCPHSANSFLLVKPNIELKEEPSDAQAGG